MTEPIDQAKKESDAQVLVDLANSNSQLSKELRETKEKLKQKEDENRELKSALKDLIPIAERTAITVDNVDWRQQWQTKRNAIEKAKLLTK